MTSLIWANYPLCKFKTIILRASRSEQEILAAERIQFLAVSSLSNPH